MLALVGMMAIGAAIIGFGVMVVWERTGQHAFLLFCVVIGAFITSLFAFELGKEVTKGTPFDSIKPGRYTVVKVKTDDSFVTDRDSRTFLILKKGEKKDPEFYALPTNELEGTPTEGGALEISEIPSSTKMVFRK